MQYMPADDLSVLLFNSSHYGIDPSREMQTRFFRALPKIFNRLRSDAAKNILPFLTMRDPPHWIRAEVHRVQRLAGMRPYPSAIAARAA